MQQHPENIYICSETAVEFSSDFTSTRDTFHVGNLLFRQSTSNSAILTMNEPTVVPIHDSWRFLSNVDINVHARVTDAVFNSFSIFEAPSIDCTNCVFHSNINSARITSGPSSMGLGSLENSFWDITGNRDCPSLECIQLFFDVEQCAYSQSFGFLCGQCNTPIQITNISDFQVEFNKFTPVAIWNVSPSWICYEGLTMKLYDNEDNKIHEWFSETPAVLVDHSTLMNNIESYYFEAWYQGNKLARSNSFVSRYIKVHQVSGIRTGNWVNPSDTLTLEFEARPLPVQFVLETENSENITDVWSLGWSENSLIEIEFPSDLVLQKNYSIKIINDDGGFIMASEFEIDEKDIFDMSIFFDMETQTLEVNWDIIGELHSLTLSVVLDQDIEVHNEQDIDPSGKTHSVQFDGHEVVPFEEVMVQLSSPSTGVERSMRYFITESESIVAQSSS